MTDWQDVKDRIPFRQYVERHVKVNGQKKAVCLWHNDTSPSLHIYDNDFHCFVCGKTGDIFDFAMQHHGWSRQEALMELAREAGVTLEPLLPANKEKYERRERLYACLEASASAYQVALYAPFGCFALKYLKETRGLSDETIKAARIGYSPMSAWVDGFTDQELVDAGILQRGEKDGIPYQVFRDRIMIPMTDQKGRVVGFSGRDMGSKGPKYKNTPETEIFHKSQILYGISSGKGGTRDLSENKVKVCVEGHIDVISAYNQGFKNVCAQMGTSLSDDQFALLLNTGVKRLVFCLDNDRAGNDALHRLVEKHLHASAERGVDLYAMAAPHGKDPDDTFRERPELWQPAVDAARPVVDVLIEREMSGNPQSTSDKINVARHLMPILRGSNGLVTHDNLEKLSQALGYPVDVMDGWMRTQVSVMPRSSIPTKTIPLNVSEMELKVLHGILVNDDQRWLDRANVNLAKIGAYPKALQPLSMNDFTSKPANALMACIIQGAKGERPFDDYVLENVGDGPLSEVYQRAIYRPVVESIVNMNAALAIQLLAWGDFIKAVCQLRYVRLERDITCKLITGNDLVEWCQAKVRLADYI